MGPFLQFLAFHKNPSEFNRNFDKNNVFLKKMIVRYFILTTLLHKVNKEY